MQMRFGALNRLRSFEPAGHAFWRGWSLTSSGVIIAVAVLAVRSCRIESYTAAGFTPQAQPQTASATGAVGNSPVREIHAYAPDILLVVIYAGTADTWQSDTWSVTRANGDEIATGEVHRDTVAAGAPDYQVGWGKPYKDNVLQLEHRIFLSLRQPIANIESLRIRGPQGIDVVLPFNDRFTETPVIHLNQVGYNPQATRRFAYVSGWMGDGGPLGLSKFPSHAEVIEDATGDDGSRRTIAAGLPITVRSTFDIESGGEVRQIDLSGIQPAERPFRIRLPGVGVSWATSVSDSARFQAFYVITRGLFLNRWGGDLQPELTTWSRPPDYHTTYTSELTDFTRFPPADTPKIGQRRITAGYHDAGDFEQRPMSTVVPQLLMRAFELNARRFGDGQLNLPESGNGIPDFLDEALWGVSFWKQLQEADGGVRQGLQSYRFPWGFYLASDDPLPYFAYSREPNVTARAAGLFAQASRLVAPYDSKRAQDLKACAVRAWSYADATGAANSYRLYAAGELYRITQDRAYKDAFENAWRAIGRYGAFSNFAPYQLTMDDYKNGNRSMADFIQGYLKDPSASTDIRSAALTWLTKYADDAAALTEHEHAHRNPRPQRFPMDWGQGTTMGRFLDTVIARMQLGSLSPQQRQSYFDALSLAADYMLGGNPNGFVYITGLGSRHVQEPLHLDSLTFIKLGKGPMPGIPVFGPTDSAPKATYSAAAVAAFYPAFDQRPEALRYADVRTVPNFNEFSVWETQAPDAELFAILLGLNDEQLAARSSRIGKDRRRMLR